MSIVWAAVCCTGQPYTLYPVIVCALDICVPLIADKDNFIFPQFALLKSVFEKLEARLSCSSLKATITVVKTINTVFEAILNAFRATSPPFKATEAPVERIHPLVGTTATTVEAILLLSERRRLQRKQFKLTWNLVILIKNAVCFAQTMVSLIAAIAGMKKTIVQTLETTVATARTV
jgi:hypothetical protein